MEIYGTNLYLVRANSTVVKFTDITWVADMSILFTAIGYVTQIIAISDIKFYLVTQYYIYEASYVDSEWDIVKKITVDNGMIFDGADSMVSVNSLGYIIVEDNANIKIYTPTYELYDSITIPSIASYANGVSHLAGTAPLYLNENIYIVCGHESDEVWKICPDGYWDNVANTVLDTFWAATSYTDATMDLTGVIGKIVSNYEDLGITNYKRVRQAQLETMSEYATSGVFALESDFTTNTAIHVDDETTEPSDSVSRAPFVTGGQQTWNTNSSFNSGTVENWETHRLDVGALGRKFRYSIKFGDVPGANSGSMYLKPPQFDAQIKGKNG